MGDTPRPDGGSYSANSSARSSAHVSSQAPQAAPSAPAAALQAGTHVIKSVVERKSASGRVYYLVTTQAGLVAHTWSSTVAGEAGQAKTDGCPVRLVGKDTTFASAPLQITKVERAEREPGDEAF